MLTVNGRQAVNALGVSAARAVLGDRLVEVAFGGHR